MQQKIKEENLMYKIFKYLQKCWNVVENKGRKLNV